MPMKTKKPETEEEFISAAKTEKVEKDLSELDFELRKDKTFLLRIPQKLHGLAKEKAANEKISLHDYILIALKEKVLSKLVTY